MLFAVDGNKVLACIERTPAPITITFQFLTRFLLIIVAAKSGKSFRYKVPYIATLNMPKLSKFQRWFGGLINRITMLFGKAQDFFYWLCDNAYYLCDYSLRFQFDREEGDRIVLGYYWEFE